ncbi:hypothetical protein B0T14DRAFT_567423 [Immersiella caudata]|uniref:DUF6594 domain-containing protein n=1 Tax=Immersiella caudata TaxID=314043 RepID=A0AA40C135_9PEZI|nr:hypothetical protein B0T14DRAFT_567423 [Immersiella caudata]
MPAGYTRLASLMGAHPEMAILRRFGSLNVLNLLYLQAELTNLENELHCAARVDSESGHPDRAEYSRDWETLRNSVADEDGDPTQWKLMLQVREKLVEYNQALLVQHKIAGLGPPNNQDLRFLRKWMNSPSMGIPGSADGHQNTVEYSQEKVESLLAALGAVIGSILIVASIAVLYCLGSTEMRLLAIGLFTTGFSLGLCWFTNARMVEVFSAAAA